MATLRGIDEPYRIGLLGRPRVQEYELCRTKRRVVLLNTVGPDQAKTLMLRPALDDASRDERKGEKDRCRRNRAKSSTLHGRYRSCKCGTHRTSLISRAIRPER